MEPLKISWNLLILIFAIADLECVKFTPQRADTAADAPLLVDNRYIRIEFNGLHRADVDTRATAGALVRECFAGKIDRHQVIPGDLAAPDRTNIPAGTATAVAIVLYLAGRIIDKMNQPGFSGLAYGGTGRSARNLFAQSAFNEKICHLIEFKTDF